jgi:hypothetical protein
MPLWFLTILVVIQVLLPDPNYKPISDESADTPLNINLALRNKVRKISYFLNILVIFSSILIIDNGSYTLYIIPDTPNTRNFSDLMQKYWVETNWLNTLPGNTFEFPLLLFEFLNSEQELEDLYADKDIPNPVQLAVVFDQDENLFDYTKNM